MKINSNDLKQIIINSNLGNVILFKSDIDEYNNKEYITIFSDTNNAIFKKNDTQEIIKLDLNDLENNQYGINDIIEEYIIEDISEQLETKTNIVLSDEFDEQNIEDIGEETFIRQLSLYERNYSYNELKESLIDSLKQTLYTKNNIYTYDFLNKKSELLLSLMMNENLYKPRKPIINQFINNNYEYLIKPIINDIKKIYTSSTELLQINEQEDFQDKIFPDTHFSNFNNELMGLQDLNLKYYTNDIDRLQYLNYITSEYVYTTEDLRNITIKSIDRPYFKNENIQNNYFTSINNNSNQEIYRNCDPKNGCNSLDLSLGRDKIIKNKKLYIRKLESSIYNFQDILTDRIITDRNALGLPISLCHGTGKIPEYLYSSSNNKIQHKISDFNKIIVEPPHKVNIIEGEEINIEPLLNHFWFGTRSINCNKYKFFGLTKLIILVISKKIYYT